MNHIELFAGCGGLSLGLEREGFELTLANELSPMAGETFAYNFLKEDLAELAEKGRKNEKVFWLSSRYSELSKRLRENPFEYPDLNEGKSDIPHDPQQLKGKLLIGNIIHLNQLLGSNAKLRRALKTGFGSQEVDLVSGGPPCQSFSLAGLRKRDCDKNTLPWEFANFVEHIQPKVVVLENVAGILRAFKEDGVSYYAWFEIAKVFAEKGYVPLCLHINARLAGVPQNRPRFIMIGIRKNIYQKLSKRLNDTEKVLLAPSEKLFKAVNSGEPIQYGEFPYYDAQRGKDLGFFKKTFLKPLVESDEVSVEQAIGDIKFTNPSSKSKFVRELNSLFKKHLEGQSDFHNHEPRNNNELVKRRFRIYQVIQRCGKSVAKEVFSILRHESQVLSDSCWQALKEHKYLLENGEYVEFEKRESLVDYLSKHPTKKQTQKALNAFLPAPAALSIPDDACHYDDHELRTLTVREMARIQSFPDNFVFRSKVTTGGRMRRFEVPQYTQVGNAVPPLLGLAIGKSIKNMLGKL